MKKVSDWIKENKLISLLILALIIWGVWYFFIRDNGAAKRMFAMGGGIFGSAPSPAPAPNPSGIRPLQGTIAGQVRQLETCKCPDGTYKALCCDNEKINQLKRAIGKKPLPVTLPPSCVAWIYSQANDPNNGVLFKNCIADMGRL